MMSFVRSRMVPLGTVGALCVGSLVMGSSAVAAEGSWIAPTQDGYWAFTQDKSYAASVLGETPTVVSAQANIGPNGTIADLDLDASGNNLVGQFGPVDPGLYYYRYIATMENGDIKEFADPSNPNTIDSMPNWQTFFVPGESVAWMDDIATGGQIQEITYSSTVTGSDREALVWTPPSYDSNQEYPVLYLPVSGDQEITDWTQLGRVKQIMDNLTVEGQATPMIVVIADTEVADPRAELLDSIIPTIEDTYKTSSQRAIAGINESARTALDLTITSPGEFNYVGSFSGYTYSQVSPTKAEAINNNTELIRLYSGNQLDPSYNTTLSLSEKLSNAGVNYQSDGYNPKSGATWDTWRLNLRDFAARAFTTDTDPAISEGNETLDTAYTAPEPGTITTPHVDENGLVTFETGTQWADAKYVTVWANWAPNGAWFRVPLEKQSNGTWRSTVGPLDGFYYYRYVVDRQDVKDPQDTINTLTDNSPLFVPGETDQLLADAPEESRGGVEVMTYASSVTGGDRQAYVWTPVDYDPNREEPYPVLYLNHGAGQSWGDWVEVGRAPQILDNLYSQGKLTPMIVVMADGNVDFQKEIIDNVVPATEAQYNASTDPQQRALAGLSMGAMNTLNTFLSRPGIFAYVGAFSGFLFGVPSFDADEVNAKTKLVRLYTGDRSDFTYNNTMSLMQTLDDRGVNYEFAGVVTGPHGFDTWSANLIDFAPRLFTGDVTEGIPLLAEVDASTGGSLVMTVADYGQGVTLSKTVAGDRLRFQGALPQIKVTDSRTAAQAGLGGWAVTGQAYTFSTGSTTIGAEHLGWTPTLQTQRNGLAPGTTVTTTIDNGPGLKTPATLATANNEGRLGSATIDAGLTLDLPVGTNPGAYQGTLSLSLFPLD